MRETQLAEAGPAGTAVARAGLTDPVLVGGIAGITAMIAAQLDDGARTAEVMPVITDTAPALTGTPGPRRRAARRRRRGSRRSREGCPELGTVTAYLRDPQVENVDINGCDQNLPNSPTLLAFMFLPLPSADLAATAVTRSVRASSGR